MSAELVKAGVATPTDVVGTVHLVDEELVLRIRPAYRDTTTRPIHRQPADQPGTLSALGFMRYVGPCSPAAVAEHHRIVTWCTAHPFLAWLRGWTR